MRGTIVTILGTVICVIALVGWSYTAPAEGSGWILFVAFVGTLGLLDSIRKIGLATVASVIIAATSGTVWYFHCGVENSGWVLFLCILVGLHTFSDMSDIVSAETKNKKSKKSPQ